MKLWAAFYPYILVYLPGMAKPVIDEHLRLACIEFCERSQVWRQWLGPVSTVASQKVYSLPLVTNQELVQLEAATLSGSKLILTTLDELDSVGEIRTHTPAIYMVDRTQFSLTQIPTAAGLPILAQVTLKPSLAATDAPDQLFATYAPVIAKGAIASAMLIPGDTFNPSMSAVCRADFLAAANAAAFDRDRMFSRARLRTQLSPI